ncbi:hypothetical protein CONPUDRAFT_32007, partial [Coniophora puteana RWD-64-598 SS2]
MLGHIQRGAPKLLEPSSGTAAFKCSDSFVRKFLHTRLNWVTRAGTKAAQKTPEDASRQLLQLFFRLALTIRDYDIPDASLVVNFDQTQVIVAHNDNRTYDQRGAKQVAITNKEEKRAWTAVVGVSASGEVLPLQVIMKG